MNENQKMEWKEVWNDDYLKWICGFANAQGGCLVIGKNDEGQVTGVSNARKLLEDLPNKIRDLLGIMVEVNLKSSEGRDYLEIHVEPYPAPVSFRGRYYFRSGSTKQELKGSALDRFLLGKLGRHAGSARFHSGFGSGCIRGLQEGCGEEWSNGPCRFERYPSGHH